MAKKRKRPYRWYPFLDLDRLVYRREDHGYRLVRKVKDQRVWWSLEDAQGKVISTQYELPAPGMPDGGAPVTWANEMLAS